jgi:hypothetical protein
MDEETISLKEIEQIIADDLADASPDERALFARAAVTPTKWELSPWGDPMGGFWVVAVMDDRVLWYNDIEYGFNVSQFSVPGHIPSTEYWCNQDDLRVALPALEGLPQGKFGPPEPLE